MGTNSTGCTEWERDFDPATERPHMKPLEPLLPGETRSEYITRVDRPTAWIDAAALQAAREIVAINETWTYTQKKAAIQVIVAREMMRACRTPSVSNGDRR